MKSNYIRECLVVFCALFALMSSEVFAADFQVRADTDPAPGNGIFTGVQDGDRITFEGGGNRSYCCSIATQTVSDNPRFTSVVSVGGGTPAVTFTQRGRQATPFGTASNPASVVCFVVELSNLGASSLYELIALTVDLDVAFASTITTSCEETTYHGGYNTFSSNFNFLELTNLADYLVSGKIILFADSAGPSVPPTTLALFLGVGRTDVNIHQTVGPAAYGRIRIPHDGLPGSIQAYLAEYKSETTGGFTLTARTALRIRSDN